MTRKGGYVVSCPCCGQVFNKSTMTESRTKCKRCGSEVYNYLWDGVYLSVDLDAVYGGSDYRIRNMADKLNSLAEKGAFAKV